MSAAPEQVATIGLSERVRPYALTLALLIFSNGPVFFISRRILDRPGTWEEFFVRPAFTAAALIGAFFFVAAVADRGIRTVPPAAFFAIIFTAIAIASVRWSFAPHLTGWRSWIYVGMLCAGWVLATVEAGRYRTVLWAFVLSAIAASLVLIALFPGIGIDETGSWRGIYTGPNSLAPIAALAAILSVEKALWPSVSRDRVLGVAMALLSAILLVGSESATAVVSTVMALGAAGLIVGYRTLATTGRNAAARILGGGSVAFAAIAGAIAGPILWRTQNFEQRQQLWDLLADRIRAHPTKGYGFFAYWDIPSLLVPRLLVRSGSAHNSFMEVLLGLGFIGLAVFVPIMLLAVIQPLRDGWRHFDSTAFLWIAVTFFAVLSNMTESFILWFSYLWIIVLAGAIRRPRPVVTDG